LAERQAEKSDEEEAEDTSDSGLKFSIDEEGDAEGGKRGKGAPKRRVPAAGTGGRKPAQKK